MKARSASGALWRSVLAASLVLAICGCGQEPPPSPETLAFRRATPNATIVFAGQSNAVAVISTDHSWSLAHVYNEAAFSTWNGEWVLADARLPGDAPPGVGLLIGAFGWLAKTQHDVHLKAIGQPKAGASISALGVRSQNFLQLKERIIAAEARPDVLLWHQGETDGFQQTSTEAYRLALTEQVAAWRHSYPSLKYIVVFLTAEGACGFDQSGVREAQQAVAAADDRVLLIDSDDITGTPAHGDGCHYDGVGYQHQAQLAIDALVTAELDTASPAPNLE